MEEVGRLAALSRFEYEVSLSRSWSRLISTAARQLDGANLPFQGSHATGVLLFEKQSRMQESFVELVQDSGTFLPESVDAFRATAPAVVDLAGLEIQVAGARRRKLRVSSRTTRVPPAVILHIAGFVPASVAAEGWLYGTQSALSEIEQSGLIAVRETMFGRSVVDELRGAVSESLGGLAQLLGLVERSEEIGATIDLPVVQSAVFRAELFLRWKRSPREPASLWVYAPKKVPDAAIQHISAFIDSAASAGLPVN